jgi:thiosulfate/3-mercaptopyruvate sulfurtransferase
VLDEIAPFVDLAWVEAHPADVVLVDSRWYLDGSSGRDAFASGHLPGAVFVDLERVLSGPASPAVGRHPLPDPGVFARGMAELGISDSDVVVAYDDAGGVIAARLVWMLRATGRRAALLDGGLRGYSGPLDITVPERPPGRFSAVPWPAELLAGIEDTVAAGSVVLDARNRDRYLGSQDPVDPRPGHIPGAVSVPCRENVDVSGRLLDRDALRTVFADAGVVSADRVISYCGSGVTACHNLLTLEHAGFGRGRLFVGGWSQYGAAADHPVETG